MTGLREQRRLDTERAIVRSALDLLGADGLEGLTMRGLAKRLGVTEPALYRYHRSKDALLGVLTGEVVLLLREALDRGIEIADGRAKGPKRLLVRVLLGAEVYAAMMQNRPGEATLLTLVLGDPRYLVERESSAPTVEAAQALFEQWASLIAAAQENGALVRGDAMMRGVSLWTAAHGAAQLRKFDRFDVASLNVAKVQDALVTDLLVAWGAKATSVANAREIAMAIANQVMPAQVPSKTRPSKKGT